MYCGHVTLKVKLLSKSFVAEVAREGSLFVVHQPHVSVQFVLQQWGAISYLDLDCHFFGRVRHVHEVSAKCGLLLFHLYDKQLGGRSP